MDEILFALLKKGAHVGYIRISTSQIAEICGMSQQNASRRIIELEKGEILKRVGKDIKVTDLGFGMVKEEYLELKKIFEIKKMQLKGKIIEGAGQGKYYMSLEHYKKNIEKNFGFVPYPGTLNVKIRKEDIGKRERILTKDLIIIKGFATKNRSFGELFCYPARINKINCVIVFPLRTHHEKDVIEIVAKENLRKKLKGKIIIEVD
ncbi:MAG: CTP-dependent riboflavin kinase [Candidatus ainarchaeum sp.]|nr:CTP-dependent riboflavin kinase [Candidatus ainarchaeum sp.]